MSSIIFPEYLVYQKSKNKGWYYFDVFKNFVIF